MRSRIEAIPAWSITVLGSILIGLLGLRLTHDISAYMDIILSDETRYLFNGMNFMDRIPKEWGPSYSAWYRILYIFEGDPIRLHYLNFKTLVIGNAILVFLVLQRMQVGRFVAFAVGCTFLVSTLNMTTWPFISHFVTGLVLFTLWLSSFIDSLYKKLLLFSFTALIATYARPELAITVTILYLIIGVYVLYKRFRLLRSDWLVTAICVPLVLVMFWKVDVPMLKVKDKVETVHGNFPRLVTAFGQHFNFNYIEWNDLDPEVLSTWEEHLLNEYEADISLMATLKSNIPVTVRHLTSNMRHYTVDGFDYFSGMFFPDKIFMLPMMWKVLLLILLVIGLLTKRHVNHYLSDAMDWMSSHKAEIGFSLLIAGPTAAACIIIYPRAHYMMLQVPLVLCLVIPFLLIQFRKGSKSSGLIGILVFALAIYLFIPSPDRYRYFTVWQDRTDIVNLKAIETINELAIEEPYAILCNEGTINVYLDNKEVTPLVTHAWFQDIAFDKAVNEMNIRIVYVSSLLMNDPYFWRDDAWVHFFSDPGALGFERVEIGSEDGYLLVRN